MQMDYSRFRIVAVVDWVELEIRTLKATQGKHLQAAGAGLFSHAHGINPQTGEKYPENRKNTATTRFAVRIQAPERFAAITTALNTIGDRLDPSCAIVVLGIEVALDAYAKTGTGTEELPEMTSHFLKGINRVSSNHPRIYRRKGETRAIGSHRELIQALMDGFQIGIGNGDRFQHGYLKATDNGQNLPINQHRARIEIRLLGKGCPVRTLEDLAGFDFACLSDYFRFRRFGEPQSDLERLMAERQICLGNIISDEATPAAINRKEGGTRLNKRGTKASPLNEISRSRLRKLTERWLASAGRGKNRKATTIACGNSACLESHGMDSGQARMTSLQQTESPRQCWENQATEATSKCLTGGAYENRSLNTSCLPGAPQLATPIKVVSGITPYAELLPIIHDLHQANHPPLPDLTSQDKT